MGDLDQRNRSRRFAWRLVALLLLPAVGLVVVGGMVDRTMDEFVEQSGLVDHTLDVKQRIVVTVATLRDAEAAQRAYVITGLPARLLDYYAALPRLTENLQQLAALVVDTPEQHSAAQSLNAAVVNRAANMDILLDAFQRGGIEAFRGAPELATSRQEDQAVDAVAATMLAREDDLLGRRQLSTARTANRTTLLTLGAIALSFGMMMLALLLVLREQKRRLASEANVRRSNQQLADALADAQHLSHTLRQLSALGETLQGCQSINEAVAGLQVVLPALLPKVSGRINLIDEDQSLARPIADWGSPGAMTEPFPPDDCWALRRGHAYPPENAVVDFPCRHFHPEEIHPAGHGRLCVPLLAQGELLGTLVLTSDHGIDESTRSTAVAAVEHISMAIANLRLQETLRHQSLRDPLTGLFNRRYLEASLERELSRAQRNEQPLAVLMLDIDHFKRFNDEHGHDGGDALLIQFSTLLAGMVRAEDVVCRYGGEEFTVLMQDANPEQALRRAEAICAAVRELKVSHQHRPLGAISVSIGVACFPDQSGDGTELLRQADRALYVAKRNGRDRVCMTGVAGLPANREQRGANPLKSVPRA